MSYIQQRVINGIFWIVLCVTFVTHNAISDAWLQKRGEKFFILNSSMSRQNLHSDIFRNQYNAPNITMNVLDVGIYGIYGLTDNMSIGAKLYGYAKEITSDPIYNDYRNVSQMESIEFFMRNALRRGLFFDNYRYIISSQTGYTKYIGNDYQMHTTQYFFNPDSAIDSRIMFGLSSDSSMNSMIDNLFGDKGWFLNFESGYKYYENYFADDINFHIDYGMHFDDLFVQTIMLQLHHVKRIYKHNVPYETVFNTLNMRNGNVTRLSLSFVSEIEKDELFQYGVYQEVHILGNNDMSSDVFGIMFALWLR